ncbi:unnamed protein product [Ceratitis capitata]|uniref:(Mediterranean fruit fly) hypothetical protein n=1 Tax=Ceratitis capitata TaxID=7213 RepID=A0A811U358_CERCA|nr:unnamed protein product [Ceratitis capitata]
MCALFLGSISGIIIIKISAPFDTSIHSFFCDDCIRKNSWKNSESCSCWELDAVTFSYTISYKELSQVTALSPFSSPAEYFETDELLD